MTTTPEAWDDVGCLRLQVDCCSQNVEDVRMDVEDVRLHVSQLQKLVNQLVLVQEKDRRLEREQKEERCKMKVFCIVATAVLALLVCILALQIFTTSAGSAPRLTERLSDEVVQMHVDEFKASEASTLAPAALAINHTQRNIGNSQELKQKPVNDTVAKPLQVAKELLGEEQHVERVHMVERTEKMKSRHQPWEEAQKTTKEKPSISGIIVEKEDPVAKQAHELELQNALHLQSSTDSQGRIQRVAGSAAEDPKDPKEDAKDIKDKSFNEGHDHNDGEQPREEPRGKSTRSAPNDPDATMSEDPDEEESQEAIKATLDMPSSLADHDMRTLPPLPFQMLDMVQSDYTSAVLKRARHGMFWVCFPPSALEQNATTYTPVFNKVARSWMWRMYPLVYLDTRRLDLYNEHFCDDVTKITFVMEKRLGVVSDNKRTSRRRIPSDSRRYVRFLPSSESPVWFRRVFEPDQVIQASVVNEFLNDINSGKLPEITPAKDDL